MLGKTKKIHLIGIGGVGMSGIAEFLHNQGFIITGSDINYNQTIEHLRNKGIDIIKGHSPIKVLDADVVVKSSAITDDNIEVKSAKDNNIPVIRRAEMLAEIMRMSYGIAIAGTHGKTTTTSMVGMILMSAALEPTVIVGGKVINFGANNILGCGKQIVVEADEFDRSFLSLSPIIAGITNIEADHLDCYNNLDDIKNAFIEYANKVPFFGCIVVCIQDKGVKAIVSKLHKRIITYSINEEADLQAVDIEYGVVQKKYPHLTRFKIKFKKHILGEIDIRLFGEHNVLNALMAIAIALELDIPFKTIKKALAEFQGVFRRCEYKGSINKIHFYDDYAHHPSEIIATLEGLKKTIRKDKSTCRTRIVVLFQPHLYSRTADFYEEFGHSLTKADVLIVSPIFPAREKPISGISGDLIAKSAEKSGHDNVKYINKNENIVPYCLSVIKEHDIFITIGAGDVYKYGEKIIKTIKQNR